MKTKITFILVFSFLILGFKIAHAEVIINEIAWMGTVDSQYGEWIELYNDSSSEVNLADWKLYEEGGSVLIFTLTKVIPANGFLVIERTTASTPDPLPEIDDESGPFGGSGLNNSGEFLVLKDSTDSIIDSLDFSTGWPAGDATTKDTMQFDGSSWITASPTPGLANENTSSDPPPPNNDDEESSNPSSGGSSNKGETKKEVIKNPTMKADILANTLAFVGQPHQMKVKVLGYSNEDVVLGKAYWNFGDGTSLEQVNNFEKFSHTYFYPGEYPVLLEYYAGHFSKEPEATDKIIVKVISTTVVISKVGDTKDFFIELTNEANSDIDISNWNLRAGSKTFILPKNSVILSKKKMTLASRLTGFSFGDQYSLKLFSASDELMSDFNLKKEIIELVAKVSSRNQATKVQEINLVEDEKLDVKEETTTENKTSSFDLGLSASAFSADEANNKNRNNSYLFFWGFVVLLIVSGGIVYYLRQNKNNASAGDDFKILDE